MKVIIPLAGKGTRLRPHTHVTPKPMLSVAGKPVMSYLLDDLRKLGSVEEVIYITGHLKEKVESYARNALDVRAVFVEQQTQDGTAGAVALARPYIDQPVLIIFVDTIFDADLSVIDRTDADGIIWTKEVEDYQRFGVVVTDAQGYMTRIVEKPSTPISKRANIGLYYIRDWQLLFEQGRVLPDGRIPIHDRARGAAQGDRRRGVVRRGEAGRAAGDEPGDARAGAGAPSG
jgi:glucose-1-phosphate thymidylyltransferase